MLHFLRKIRKNLLDQNRFGRYLLYAIGEIVLLLVGILLALQINNWNTIRANDQLFEKNMEQLYNSIHADQAGLASILAYVQLQENMIRGILRNPDTLPPQEMIPTLFLLDNTNRYGSETQFLIDNTDFNPQNDEQKELVRQISNYIGNNLAFTAIQDSYYLRNNYLYKYLEEINLPVPPTFFGLFHTEVTTLDPDLYSQADLKRARDLVEREDFRAALRSLVSNKQTIAGYLLNGIEDGHSILSSIREKFPSVKLLYDNVGILGDALPTGWGQSVPMVLVDPNANIWELEIELGDGSVKFRNRDSWNQNWGGTNFPEGIPVFFGPNIPVVSGRYLVQINLGEFRYSFKKLSD